MLGKKWQGGDSRAQELYQEQGLSKGQDDVRVSLKLSTLHAWVDGCQKKDIWWQQVRGCGGTEEGETAEEKQFLFCSAV